MWFSTAAIDTAVGPTLGQTNSVAELWTDLTHMKKGAATGALAGANGPGQHRSST
jgi:hypothetical protein